MLDDGAFAHSLAKRELAQAFGELEIESMRDSGYSNRWTSNRLRPMIAARTLGNDGGCISAGHDYFLLRQKSEACSCLAGIRLV
jgi:hypothetical protein